MVLKDESSKIEIRFDCKQFVQSSLYSMLPNNGYHRNTKIDRNIS